MQVSIRQALLLALVGLVLLLTGLLVGSSLANESRLVRSVTLPLVDLYHARASRQVDELIAPIQKELAESLRMIRRGQLRPRDGEGIRGMLLHGFQELRRVDSMMVGDETGYQYLIMHYGEAVTSSPLLHGLGDLPATRPDERRFFTRVFDRARWGDHSEWTLWDEEGTRPEASWEVDLPGYQPLERPWLRQALERLHSAEAAGRGGEFEDLLAWTGVYTMFTSKTPGISASLAARGPDGDIVVVAIDLLLRDLTAFTSAQHPTPSGLVFLCDDDGRVLALPHDERYTEPPLEHLLEPLNALGIPALDGWFEQGTAAASGERFFGYRADGERWWGLRSPVELGGDRRLWIGVAVPHRDVVALLGNDQRRFLLFAGLGGAAALLLALWLAGRLSAPIARLVAESERIGHLDLDAPPVPTRSRVKELENLGRALESMRRALRAHMTERDHALLALASSELRFRGTFEQVAVGLIHVAPDGSVLLVNQKLCQILGYSRAELLSMSFVEFTHPDDREADLDRMRTFLKDGPGTASWEKRYLHRDGHVVWAEVTTSLQLDEEGAPRYFVTVVQDIGKRKELESQLLQSQKLEAVGRLAGGVAHDFNNLLTVISGYSQTVRMHLGEGHVAQSDLAQIEQAVDSAAALTHQLLAFARRDVTAPRVLDVEAEVRRNQDMLQRLLGEDVELVTLADDGAHSVLIDPVQLQQVLVNLAVNARDAMPGGGRLTLAVSARAAPEGEGGEVELAVSDTGHGMDAEVRAHVFEPFFTTKGVGQGTGLGLATCYGIVKRAGGSVEIESAPGGGTSVFVRLPESLERPTRVDEEERDTPALRGGTILLVEDEEQIRSLVGRVLGEHGFRVLTASGGAQALEVFAREDELDLVVTDVVMPGMSGGELAERLRSRRPDLRVLFVSGYTHSALAEELPGGTEFLAKPYTPTQLLERIRHLLSTAPSTAG